MFNALKYTKKLEEVGLTREQAETHVQMVIEVMDSNFATKTDFNELKNEMRAEFAAVRAEAKSEFTAIRSEMSALKSELKADMARLEYRLVVKLGVLLSSIMTLGFTAVSLVIAFH